MFHQKQFHLLTCTELKASIPSVNTKQIKKEKKKNPIQQWPETILCGLNLIKQDYHNLPIVIILKTTKNAMEILFHRDVCIFLSLINDHSLAVTNILENTNKS